MKTLINNKRSSHLSIVIPTYNRAKFLDRCLELLIPVVMKYNIAIYISDNSSKDNTKEVVDKRIKSYRFIEYQCNQDNLGADKNFELALKMPMTDYIWLLGDTYQIKTESVNFLMEILLGGSQDVNAFVFNVIGRVGDIPSISYSDKNKLLLDLGWHMTCMSSLVYARDLISSARFERYRDTNFIQTRIIFEFIENREFVIRWVSEHSIFPVVVDGVKKNSWQNKTFQIWVESWINFICSLPPSYAIDEKLRCIKMHGSKSGLFSLRGLLSLREKNILNIMEFKKYQKMFSGVINIPTFIIFFISIFPKSILRIRKYFF